MTSEFILGMQGWFNIQNKQYNTPYYQNKDKSHTYFNKCKKRDLTKFNIFMTKALNKKNSMEFLQNDKGHPHKKPSANITG